MGKNDLYAFLAGVARSEERRAWFGRLFTPFVPQGVPPSPKSVQVILAQAVKASPFFIVLRPEQIAQVP
ncbi:MAG TPA: hypothetical protein VMY42_12315, partial [Thermoguttaceae bacterium]|nr:hypothetical protein [Thermoguttaceae bacterium]